MKFSSSAFISFPFSCMAFSSASVSDAPGIPSHTLTPTFFPRSLAPRTNCWSTSRCTLKKSWRSFGVHCTPCACRFVPKGRSCGPWWCAALRPWWHTASDQRGNALCKLCRSRPPQSTRCPWTSSWVDPSQELTQMEVPDQNSHLF